MTQWLVDSHVHFYNCFDREKFFDNVFNNLLKNSNKLGANAIIFLTQGRKENSYNELKNVSVIFDYVTQKNKYIISSLDDNLCLKVQSIKENLKLFIIPGFQIVTKENLELLSIGTLKRQKDGLTLEETINNVIQDEAIPIIPWGFGKWYGKRGNIVNDIIHLNIPNLFLGDNGGRTYLLPYPSQFNHKNIKILPGSDPLPLKQEIIKPLSYGFKFDATLNESNIWKELKSLVISPKFKILKFGKIANPYAFLITQIKINFSKNKN